MHPPPAIASVDDADNDGLVYQDELLTGNDPANQDSEADGIHDGVDPSELAHFIRQLPKSSFKDASANKGLRNALLMQLKTNQRRLEKGQVDLAIDQLERMRRHMDGCPTVADRNDWIIDCETQLQARRLLDALLNNHVRFEIDSALQPPVDFLPGINGGTERPVGLALGPDGIPEPYVANEVILHTHEPMVLEAFLAHSDGIVLRDGKARLIPGEQPAPGIPADRGSYLIRVNPDFSALGDLAANFERIGIRGSWQFSSEWAARTAALVARDTGFDLTLNFTMQLSSHPVLEHPDGYGGHVDASTWPWMTEDDDPNQAGDQGLSIGVVNAWDYVQYKGYPPVDQPYYPVKVAVIDAGFDLDEQTGDPLYGIDDYPLDLPQLDEIDVDWTAGGAGYGFDNCNGCWHGQLTFGVCCALSGNHYGTASTSRGWDIKPLLIKATADIDTVNAGIYNAIYNNADVIHETIGFECGTLCGYFDGGNEMAAYVGTARSQGKIVVTPAMNQKRDISGSNVMPCNQSATICVGAIDHDKGASDVSNWGSIVDIWAPTNLYSTVTRDTFGNLGIKELSGYGGTSAATPFVTGIVALMKMLNPALTVADVRSILNTTANSATDPKVQAKGYVDALRAVEAASPNQAPLLQILQPANGADEAYSNIYFKAQVTDPEVPNPYGSRSAFDSRITFSSDLDGELCSDQDDATANGTVLACEVAELSIGTHTIDALVTDPFGATASQTFTLNVINDAPITRITYPLNGAVFTSNQFINLRGYGFDAEVYGFIPVSWSSDLSGVLGSGDDIWVSLPQGNHTITLSATDEKGATASDSISVTVLGTSGGGGFPQVTITQPANGEIFGPGVVVTLQGQAQDPEDGQITDDSAFSWSSNEDGALGTGRTLAVTLSVSGESTVHTITLEVSDSDGNTASHSINLAIVDLQ